MDIIIVARVGDRHNYVGVGQPDEMVQRYVREGQHHGHRRAMGE